MKLHVSFPSFIRKIQTSGASDVPLEEWGVLGSHELIARGSSQTSTFYFSCSSVYGISVFCELQELLLNFLVM